MHDLKTLLWTITVFFQLSINAQDTEGFVALQSHGKLPEDFTKLSVNKFLDDYSENIDEDLDQTFFLNSRFLLDRLLLGGLLVFNEPCSDYVNEVADYILSPSPELRDQLRFYILKSNVANAFSTDQGIIIITTALLAALENEAQLAFILAHEISHYTEEHVRKSYVFTDSLEKGIEEYNSNDLETKVQRLSQYSKQHEFMADRLGIDYYLESEYDINEAISVFDVLQYSHIPYAMSKLDPSFLSTDLMRIPDSYFDYAPNPIVDNRFFEEDQSTHPNIGMRVDSIEIALNNRNSKGNLKYKISEEKFAYMQEQVRLDQINLCLSQRDYCKALLCISFMEKMSNEKRFLTLSKIRAIYGLAKYKNRNRLREVVSEYGNSEGEISILNRFFFDLSKTDLSIMAYRHAYDASVYYEETIFDSYENDMFLELTFNSRIDEDKLKDEIYVDTVSILEADLDSVETFDDGDIDYLKGKEARTVSVNSENNISLMDKKVQSDFFLHALSDLVSEKELKEEIARVRDSDSFKPEVGYLLTEHRAEYGFSLGLDDVVIIDSRFEKYNFKKERLHIASEKFKISMSEFYVKDYAHLNMKRSMIDSKNLGVNDTQKYNDLGLIYQWLIEVVQHQGMNIISSTNERMEAVRHRYGSKHFLFSGVYAYPRLIPFSKKNYTQIRALVLNSETDKLEFILYNNARVNPESLQMEAYIFNILYQLNREPKKKPW